MKKTKEKRFQHILEHKKSIKSINSIFERIFARAYREYFKEHDVTALIIIHNQMSTLKGTTMHPRCRHIGAC